MRKTLEITIEWEDIKTGKPITAGTAEYLEVWSKKRIGSLMCEGYTHGKLEYQSSFIGSWTLKTKN